MKAIKTALSACALFSAAFAGYAEPKASDFKVKLVGVSIERADADDFSAKSLPPDKRIVVTPGNLAVFRLEYDFPEGVKSRLFLGPNFDESKLGGDPFGTSASGLLSGKGSVDKVIILGAGGSEPYEQELLLKSVRISGEIESKKGARRNGSFFICDAPVNVLFANKGDADGSKAKVLDPRPSPAPDTSLGVVAPDKPGKPRSSTPAGFTDDLDAAFAKAKAEGKFVYACFSGSDWCGWCMKLEREVFSKPEFISGVKDDYVLVFIDLPEDKSLLSEHAKSANPALVDKYRIRGFPTALVFDGDGRKIGETGYRKGGAKAYVDHLMSFRKRDSKGI
ncbi:MAG: thioredoxin family protein [Kiritimatiellae bacterium]|nr:thioredoxin family protein [Kiritimatiellia bacterium]